MIDLCSSSEDSNSDGETIDSSNERSEGGDSDSAGSLIDFIDDSAYKKKRTNTKVDEKNDNVGSETHCSQKKRRRVIVLSSSDDNGDKEDDKDSVFSLSSWGSFA